MQEKTEQELRLELETLLKEVKPATEGEINRFLDGSLIYGPPWNKKRKLAVEWAKNVIKDEGLTIEREIFEINTPYSWVFFYSREKGVYKIFIGDLV